MVHQRERGNLIAETLPTDVNRAEQQLDQGQPMTQKLKATHTNQTHY